METAIRIGIDIGGTDTKIGLVDGENRLIAQKSIPTGRSRDAEEVLEDIGKAVLKLLEEKQIPAAACLSAGVGCPGTIDAKNGTVVYSNNLNWKDVKLTEILKRYLPLPIAIGNDADCAALGEAVAGAARGAKNVIMITLGTGVGGGIILDGKVFGGALPGGGEIGHMVVQANGEQCTCGRKGCLEAYASASALIRDAKAALIAHPESLMMQMCDDLVENMNGKIPFEAAKQGDEAAKAVVEHYVSYLAAGIANLINIFRPEQIIIGGGISKQGDYLTNAVRVQAYHESFGQEGSALPEIKIATLGNDAGMIGAANL